jgi:hypothetical protein
MLAGIVLKEFEEQYENERERDRERERGLIGEELRRAGNVFFIYFLTI